MKTENLVLREVTRMREKGELQEGFLYYSKKYQIAIHLCACGCKGETVTPLDDIKGWILTLETNGPTLRPSIGNQAWPCGSHYWVTDGKIVWC